MKTTRALTAVLLVLTGLLLTPTTANAARRPHGKTTTTTTTVAPTTTTVARTTTTTEGPTTTTTLARTTTTTTLAPTTTTLAPGTTGQSWLVPGYQYPTDGTMWATLADTAPTTRPAYVIANVNSGPGTTLDSNYASAISKAAAAGWTILGYVDTAEASAPTSSVEPQVEQWRSFYGVQDIFFDDVTGAAANVGYYETLTGYVHSLGGIDILNPGAPPASGYLSTNVCNGIVVMEDTLSAFQSNPPPDYSGSPVQIAYIITSGPSQADLLPILQAIKARGGGLVYVTDQGNSYNSLPSYFAAENADF